MGKTEIERKIVSKQEKTEENKNISEVLTKNANASASMNMPRPSKKKVFVATYIATNLENKNDLNKVTPQYKSPAEKLKAEEEELYKSLMLKEIEIDEDVETTEEMDSDESKLFIFL